MGSRPPKASAPQVLRPGEGLLLGSEGSRAAAHMQSGKRVLCPRRPTFGSEELVQLERRSCRPGVSRQEQAGAPAASLPPWGRAGPGRRPLWAGIQLRLPSPPPAGRCPLGDGPWERALPGPEGTVACPGPHAIAVITAAIGTVNQPVAVLLTAGSWGQEVQQPPGPRRPGSPAAVAVPARPSQGPRASPSPAGLASGRKGAGPAGVSLFLI